MMKILIVDDENVIRQGIRSIIHRSNKEWITEEAIDGLEALEIIEKNKPDVVITDIRMPEISGIELTKLIKERYSDIQIIIISGYSEFNFAQEALRYGVIDYLLKPTKPEDLVNTLNKAEDSILNLKNRIEREEKFHLEVEALKKEMEEKLGFYINKSEEKISKQEKQRYRRVVELAISYIEKNYFIDLTLKHISEVVYMNSSYFCELFKHQTGQGFSEYLTKLRIDKAKEILLSNVKLKSYEVAELVGYKDPKYFTQIFKKLVGFTPTEYRDGKKV